MYPALLTLCLASNPSSLPSQEVTPWQEPRRVILHFRVRYGCLWGRKPDGGYTHCGLALLGKPDHRWIEVPAEIYHKHEAIGGDDVEVIGLAVRGEFVDRGPDNRPLLRNAKFISYIHQDKEAECAPPTPKEVEEEKPVDWFKRMLRRVCEKVIDLLEEPEEEDEEDEFVFQEFFA